MKCAYSQTIEIEEKNEMPLVNKIKDIHYLIAENYSDKEPLKDYQKKSRDVFYGYCKDIENALERLEKLEKAIDIIKRKHVNIDNEITDIDNYKEYRKVFWCIYEKLVLTEEEFNLLKEVFCDEN